LKPTIEITPQDISAVLDESVIDHAIQGDEAIYVTGLAFNFWIRLEAERSLLILSTYWEFMDDITEIEKLRCINTLNLDLLMIQFSIGEPGNRLSGHYSLPACPGFDRRQFLRATRMFADIFRSAVTSSEQARLIQPWPDDRGDDGPSSQEPKLLN
jgi:hypothetical protein